MDVKNIMLDIVNTDLEARGLPRLKMEPAPTMIPDSLTERLNELSDLIRQVRTIAGELYDSFSHLNQVLERERDKHEL